MYRNDDQEDLRNEIYHLKKQLQNVNTENHLLKVRIRKLLDEIGRKDKQLDAILDPRKSPDIRKILFEKSASFVMNVKDKNDKLKKAVSDKDLTIKRLQHQLEVTKLYSQHSKRPLSCKCNENNKLINGNIAKKQNMGMKNDNSIIDEEILTQINFKNGEEKFGQKSWTPDVHSKSLLSSVDSFLEKNSGKIKRPGSYELREQYRGLSRDHLLSIIENLKGNQNSSSTSRQTSSRKYSPVSDWGPAELFCDSPHEEIQQLHLNFLHMISEVDFLKGTIYQMQNDQLNDKTNNDVIHVNIEKKDNLKVMKNSNPKHKVEDSCECIERGKSILNKKSKTTQTSLDKEYFEEEEVVTEEEKVEDED